MDAPDPLLESSPGAEPHGFTPPYPDRPTRPLSGLEVLIRGRRNFLTVWREQSFELELMSSKVLSRTVWICNSPDTVRHAFITANAGFERKSPQMRTALKPLLGDGLFISDGETWKMRRRIVAPIVHASRMAEFAPLMVEAAGETIKRWRTEDRIDALGEMARLAAEIICRTLFGRELGQASAREVVQAFSDYQELVGQMDLMSFLGLPEWLPRFQAPRTYRAAQRIRAVLDGVIDSYERDRRAGDHSLIGALLEAKDDQGVPLSRAAVRNEIATLFMAGHETTANTLAWAWYLLSQAPHQEARLHAELDVALEGRTPTLSDIGRLPYTRAVVEETMRLYPPVPLLAREAGPGERLRDKVVEPGSLVIVVPWLLHRHRKFWSDPDRFAPERFLPGAPPPDRYVYVPFSIGPRVCAGLSFGLTEAILCLATLAQAYRLRLAQDARVEPVCRLSLRPGKDLPMTVHPRARGVPQPDR